MRNNVEIQIDESTGQVAGRDIHNHYQLPSVSIENIAGGTNVIGSRCDIHFHLTLPSAEMLTALIDLLKLASSGNQMPAH
ncbi:hypothetical protein [Dechloromonas denitrificans]|uniref:hypothetical protein n=1 Tax=Dechloromonas denitrificans TaxID=281362 RepID=UPI001CFB9095|nr:hypothetical protein [Dechloromonas denitrificans]UCV08470.1 hypothetical protein KI615_02760 [Dechloromonas denitrificans]